MITQTHVYDSGRKLHCCVGLLVGPHNDESSWVDCVAVAPGELVGMSDAEIGAWIRDASTLVPRLRAYESNLLDEQEAMRTRPILDDAICRNRPSNLYVMESNGLFKIGYGKSVASRQRALRTASGYPVSIVASWAMPIRDARAQELRWHEHFAAQRMAGEWFSLNPDDVAFMQAAMRDAAP